MTHTKLRTIIIFFLLHLTPHHKIHKPIKFETSLVTKYFFRNTYKSVMLVCFYTYSEND